jgi:heat shock protein HslJ
MFSISNLFKYSYVSFHKAIMKNLSKYFSIFLLLFAFVSCSTSQTSGPPLENTMWVLTSVSSSGTVSASFNFKLSDGQINGTGPCNSFSGVYNLNGNVISVSKILATDMGCDKIQIEGEYLRLLGAAQRYEIKGGYLKLYTSVDYKTMTFAPAN